LRVRRSTSSAARRQHGRKACAHRADRRIRSGTGAAWKVSAWTGTGRVLLPIPRVRRARPLRAGDVAGAPRARGASDARLFPALVALEGRLAQAARTAAPNNRARPRPEA